MNMILWGCCLLAFALGDRFLEAAPFRTLEETIPYLMPDDHPIKSTLDALFSTSRVTFNLETLEQAGFEKARPRKFTKMIVTRHPAVPGYLFKLYLDVQRFHKDVPEYHYWILRAEGAVRIAGEIETHGWGHHFKAPKKWIYCLPDKPEPPLGYDKKTHILVVEDMQLLDNDHNLAIWASNHITMEFLMEFYLLLRGAGLDDCAKPANAPFAEDGRVAFIDTERNGRKVNFKKLFPFLSERNRDCWDLILRYQ